jgi:murein DD-endopeptidase
LRIGQKLKLVIGKNNQLKSLSVIISNSQTLHFILKGDDYIAKMETKESVWQTQLFHGDIVGSFTVSAEKAGLSIRQTYQIIGALSEKINFSRDLRTGNPFRILVSKEFVEGKYTGNSDVLAAYIKTRHNHYIAFLHDDGRYYDSKGKGLGKAYRRSPVNGNVRISSRFNPRRLHPVTGKITRHLGTDYAVGIGTKIYATGDGVILRNGRHFAAGNYIVIKNSRRYTTRFLHLSKSYVRKGQRVKMGDLIGLSGNTGRTTGPHLHFEFRINGHAVDSLKVNLPLSKEIPKDQIATFNKKKKKYMKELGLTKEDLS